MNIEKIWYNDIKNFINSDNYLNFFPTLNMTTNEQLNSILRFSLYFSIIMLLFTNNYKYLYIVVIVGGMTYAMNVAYLENKYKESKDLDKLNLVTMKNKNLCTKPTKDNPFMNFTVNEYVDNPDKKAACDINNSAIKESIYNNFNDGLLRDVDDVFSKNASDRMYYTMPNTEVMNDQTGLANWLYKRGPTCKENTLKCEASYRYAVN